MRAVTRRARALVPALAALAAAAPATAAPGDATDPVDSPAAYCDGAPDGGRLGATTDAEHERILPEPKLPAGVSRRAVRIGKLRTLLLEAGPRGGDEAVVFVHGNPGSSLDWLDLVARVGRFGRAVAFDAPGFGRADKPRDFPYGVAGYASFIDDLLGRLGVRRAHLVVHDFGGPFGLAWAARHPDRLASAVLIDTGVLIGYYGHALAHTWRTPGVGEGSMATTTRESFRELIQRGNPKPFPREFLDRMYDDFDRPTRCAVLKLYRDTDDPDGLGRSQAARLRPYDRPALVVWGKKDPYLPYQLAYRQGAAFPRNRVVIFEQAGHWPFVDEPARAAAEVVPFLRRELAGRRGRLASLAVSFRRPRGRSARRLRRIRVRVIVPGAGLATRVRVRVHWRGRLVASSGRPRSVRSSRVLRLRVRRRGLRRGRHVLRATARGLAPRSVPFRVR
jgi:pimeloyl-ACP methyl ester carboxylesterase